MFDIALESALCSSWTSIMPLCPRWLLQTVLNIHASHWFESWNLGRRDDGDQNRCYDYRSQRWSSRPTKGSRMVHCHVQEELLNATWLIVRWRNPWMRLLYCFSRSCFCGSKTNLRSGIGSVCPFRSTVMEAKMHFAQRLAILILILGLPKHFNAQRDWVAFVL